MFISHRADKRRPRSFSAAFDVLLFAQRNRLCLEGVGQCCRRSGGGEAALGRMCRCLSPSLLLQQHVCVSSSWCCHGGVHLGVFVLQHKDLPLVQTWPSPVLLPEVGPHTQPDTITSVHFLPLRTTTCGVKPLPSADSSLFTPRPTRVCVFVGGTV